MNLPRLAVHRPVSTLMASLIVVILGWVALTELAIDLMPDLEFPTVTVTTLYPGAGPEEVETLITRPLEQVLSSVSGFERLSSRSLEGSSSIRVQFTWGADLDVAVDEMRQAIDKVRNTLPDGIDLPYLRRYDANSSPIMYLGLNSDLDQKTTTRLAETSIIPRLERLEGVARVGLRGDVRREIQVNLNRTKIESLNMGVNEILDALDKGNISRPAGDFEEGHLNRLIRSRSEFQTLDEIRNLVIRQTGGVVVRVRDVADVVDGNERITERTRTNGLPGIMVYVFKQANVNTIRVSDAVHEAVADINEDLRNAELVIRLDKSDYIRESIANMQQSAVLGMGLAMVILVVFLRSFRSTLIIGVSMPLSVLAAFVMIYFKGYTLNMVSFGGLALGIGMLVDNSIVVLESIFRKREELASSPQVNKDPALTAQQAAIEGTNEVAGAITASTLTTLIVFLPLAFVYGMTGVLLHQLAFVVCCSMVCSLFASLTLTPTLAAYWLGNSGLSTQGENLLHRMTGWIFRGVESIYETFVGGVLRFPQLTAIVLLMLAAVAGGLIPRIGTDFLPATDDGRMGVYCVMAPGIQLDTLDQQAKKLEDTLVDLVPEAETTSIFIGDGADDGEDWNEARFILQLVGRDERDVTSEDIRARIAKNLPAVPGAKLRVRVYSGLPVFRRFGGDSGDALAVVIRGHDRETANQLAVAVMDVMNSVPGVVNVEKQMDDERPELVTRIDREKASHLGITVDAISQALETTFRGSEATVFREDGDEYNVRVQLRPEDRAAQTDLDLVSVSTPSGKLVPLGNLVSYRLDSAPLAVDRVDRQRVVVVTAAAENRDLGAIVGDLREGLKVVPVPADFQIDISGDWEEQQESFILLTRGFLLAVLLMYMIMAAQFESLRDPLLILVTLPLAAVGVILVLVFWDTTLNVQSFIGLIVLAGVVVNNAIVLVDYAKQLRARDPAEAKRTIIQRASVRRFRPIIMTTLTTVLGMLPIALGWGEGGELQAPMARVVIGGLISGTMITLVAIPLVLSMTMREGVMKPSGEHVESREPELAGV